MSKRRNRLGGEWVGRLTEMLESPAYRVLSLSGRRFLDRLEIEHTRHGRTENGNLIVTKQDFIKYGLDHEAVAPAARETEALGFIRMKHGQGGNAERRQPNRFFLTYALGNGPRSLTPTHDWRKIKTLEAAQDIADAARAAKDPRAVELGRLRRKNFRFGKTAAFGSEKPTRQGAVFGSDSPTKSRVRKTDPLSRSRGGGWGDEAASRTEAAADAQAEAEARDEGQAPAGNGEHLVDDGRHTRKSLMAYVANVSDEQLHDLDPARVQARQRLNWTLREQSLFDAVGKRSGR